MKYPARIPKMASQRNFIVTLINGGKTTDAIQSLTMDCYGDKAYTRRAINKIKAQINAGGDGKDGRTGSTPWVRTEDNIKLIKDLVDTDGRLTINEMVEETGLKRSTIHLILKVNLGYSIKSARWVPRLLNADQKMERVRCAMAFKKLLREGPDTLDMIVTMDETMMPDFIPERKRMSSQWLPKGSSAPIKAKTQESRKKRMVTTFFDSRGILYSTVAPLGTKINARYFIKVLDEFIKHAKRKRMHIKGPSSILLHLDNCPVHTAIITKEHMAKRGYRLVEHPPYSPDLAPADFFLFPKAKDNLAGIPNDGETAKTRWGRAISTITTNDFTKAFQKWIKRWDQAIENEGGYVKK